MNQCATCAHYKPPTDGDTHIDWICGKAVAVTDVHGRCMLTETHIGRPKMALTPAYAEDGDGYYGILRVLPTHGCLSHHSNLGTS